MINLSQQFVTNVDNVYLNHARLSPWPVCSRQVVETFVTQMQQPTAAVMLEWEQKQQQLRQQLAVLLNAATNTQVALLKNTSEALSIIATGIDWQPQDNIVLAVQEFPSNRLIWQALASQGVNCIWVDLALHADPEQALIAACNKNTRLLTVSAVQYHDGCKLDLLRLGAFCNTQTIAFCVDAAQQLGAYPIDVQSMQIDFLVACGHKWLCAAEGTGVLYVASKWLTRLKLHQYGWHMLKQADFTSLQVEIATTAQRFEAGSLNTLNELILASSLNMLLELGLQNISNAITERIDYLWQQLNSLGCEIITPATAKQRAGIISFKIPRINTAKLCQQLNQQGIICSQRGDYIRLSPHFYITETQLKTVLPKMKHCLLILDNYT